MIRNAAALAAGNAVTQAFGQIMDWIIPFYQDRKATKMAVANQERLNAVLDRLEIENGSEAQNAMQSAQIAGGGPAAFAWSAEGEFRRKRADNQSDVFGCDTERFQLPRCGPQPDLPHSGASICNL
jgi:hypothetical protein